jgi:anti-sigma regulatory factor (Ser/Thr protein kinase)
MAQEYRASVPAVMEKIEELCNFVSDVARSADLDDNLIHRCYLSVEEICTNIIEHGYGNHGEDEVIDVVCERYPDRLLVTVFDDAHPPFDPLSCDDPDPMTPLWERTGGGWGVYFVKQYMDNVYYNYEHNRNQLTIEILL